MLGTEDTIWFSHLVDAAIDAGLSGEQILKLLDTIETKYCGRNDSVKEAREHYTRRKLTMQQQHAYVSRTLGD